MHTDAEKDFMRLKGINEWKASEIFNAGFTSLDEIKKASVTDLTKVNGIGEKLAKSIKSQVKTMSSLYVTNHNTKAKKKEIEENSALFGFFITLLVELWILFGFTNYELASGWGIIGSIIGILILAFILFIPIGLPSMFVYRAIAESRLPKETKDKIQKKREADLKAVKKEKKSDMGIVKKWKKKMEEDVKKMEKKSKPVRIKCPYCEKPFKVSRNKRGEVKTEKESSTVDNIVKGAVFLPWGVISALKNKEYVKCPHCGMKIKQ